MDRGKAGAGSQESPSRGAMDRPLRRLFLTLSAGAAGLLLAFLAFILVYAPPNARDTGWIILILAALMALIMAGIQRICSLLAAAAAEGRAPDASQPAAREGEPRRGGRSVRHTIAESAALIGAIPLLSLGYILVRYALPLGTAENLLLVAVLVAVVISLGMARINSVSRRIVAVAAVARRVRMEAPHGGGDPGGDEIGSLSADLVKIAENLTLRRSELRRTRGLIERLPHPMLIVDPAGAIQFANAAALKLLDCGEAELAGREASSLFEWAEERDWILGEGGDAARENAWKRRDGTRVPVSVRAQSLSRSEGGGAVLIATDVTERDRAQGESLRLRSELVHVARASSLAVLAASLAHEINQPLAAILNNAQAGLTLLGGASPDMVEVRGALEDIIADDQRASEVIRRIRTLLKKADHERGMLDLNKTIRDAVVLLRGEARARGVSIDCDLAPSLPLVWGDGVQLQQVMLNLILNALEAMQGRTAPPSSLQVRTSHDAEGVRISVRDTGHGIGPEVMPLIFEPFYTTKADGLGMGLPINRTIVEGHKGRLWAENNSGGGATFHIVLPPAREG